MTCDIDAIMPILRQHFHQVKAPVVDFIAAQTQNPFKILVATILSARTKDETTTKVVNRLFEVIHNLEDLERIDGQDLNKMLFPVGFHNAKTIHLKQLPAVLKQRFNGSVPHEIEDLVQLPGVGRKTANLVRAMAFGLPAICVDIHVHRISNRWGYVRTKTPYETEIALRTSLPEKYWLVFNSYVVAFGQKVCTPRKPACAKCPIYDYCERIGL